MTPTLLVVIASTRPGRVGLPVAQWFEARAREHGAFQVDVADLAEIALPFMDEPNHPRLQQYVHDHTKAWSARVAAADAIVFVTPEYNYGINAPLKNAIDYLHNEWKHKPLGIVSYGGVSAGTRAAAMIKMIATPLMLYPTQAAVAIPMVAGKIGEEGELDANEIMVDAAALMLGELAELEAALRPLRG